MHLTLVAPPPARKGLTSMSAVLLQYDTMQQFRHNSGTIDGMMSLTSSHRSLEEKNTTIETVRKNLAEKFLQFCEPMEPLHLHVQIDAQRWLLTMQKIARQPLVSSTKVSELAQSDRNEMLKICVKYVQYFVMTQTTPSISHLRWINEYSFQWPSFVYVVIEAHYRASTSESSMLRDLITHVVDLCTKLNTTSLHPEELAIAHLIVAAWKQREDVLRSRGAVEVPTGIRRLKETLSSEDTTPDSGSRFPFIAYDDFADFDFDFINWSFWEIPSAS